MSEHYRLLRTDANYRHAIMMEELMAEREPAWCSVADDKDTRIQELEQKLTSMEESLISEPWNIKQWDIVNQMKAEVVGWRPKHSELQLAVDKLLTKVQGKKKKYKEYD